MLNIDQEILNQIARTQEMASFEMKEFFSASSCKADEMEEIHCNNIDKVVVELGYKNLMNGRLYSRIWGVLPLFIEHKAISNYITAHNAFHLRKTLPEVQTPKAAAQIMRKENHMLTKEEMEASEVIFEKLQKNYCNVKVSSSKKNSNEPGNKEAAKKEILRTIIKTSKELGITPKEVAQRINEKKRKDGKVLNR